MKSNQTNPVSNGQATREERFMRGRRRHKHHRLIVLLSVMLGVLFVGLAGIGLYYNHLLGKIHYETRNPSMLTMTRTTKAPTTRRTTRKTSHGETTEPVETTVDWVSLYDVSDIPVRTDPDIRNILLIGSDSYASDYYSNSDTIIILSINRRDNVIRMASILRDTGILIPGSADGIEKINSSYAYGGPYLLMETIEANFRVRIDNYIAVGFDGFDRIIDSVGGLDIDLTAAEAEVMGLQPGPQHLDGFFTEWYCRIRKIDSDFQRTSRQRHVLELLMQKARGMGAVEMANLLEEILPNVYTGLGRSEMSSLILSAPALLGYPLEQASVPLAGSYTSYDYTFHMDLRTNVEHLQGFLYGS